MNQINQITIHRTPYGWSFDDPRVGLDGEPFVAGIPEIINHYSGGEDSVVATFSKDPFPSHNSVLEFLREDSGGGWYRDGMIKKEGWLCPAVLLYFETLPERIFIKFEPVHN